MNLGLQLRKHCRINTNAGSDRFVGLRVSTGKAEVCFPMGYHLPDDDTEIRQEIIQLVSTLAEFESPEESELAYETQSEPLTTNFPVGAYMSIILDFLAHNSYYTEKEQVRKTGKRGKIDWGATLKKNIAFVEEDGAPFFSKYTIKGSTPNEKNQITLIHRFCVYEAFQVLGWLFTPHMPLNPHIEKNVQLFLGIIRKKMGQTHNEKDMMLFRAMIAMLEYLDGEHSNVHYYFGTNRFEYVWERLIDATFGVKNKAAYFPHTSWKLRYAVDYTNSALEPDTIMLHEGSIYILDAKYYRYGITNIASHLPASSSISKQITYGEYAYRRCGYTNDPRKRGTVYNAFLMPYDAENNPFKLKGRRFANIGEGVSNWKLGNHKYENVQGIVVDTRFLIHRHYASQSSLIKELAELIERPLV